MTILRKPLVRAVLLAALFSSLAAQPARASAAAVFAEGWSIGRLFSGLNNRTRIVQFCVGAMVLGLFILIKKFAAVDATDLSRGESPGLSRRPADGD
jgi:hypothetical protein